MSTPLFHFSADPKSIPVSTNTSWPSEKKYKIIPQRSGELTLQHTLSHAHRAYQEAEPLMEKCTNGDVILINWFLRPIYHYPTWRNFLYEPRLEATYCYLRKQDENVFYEYTISNQEYDTIKPIWKYSVSPFPSKNSVFKHDRYTFPRRLLRYLVAAFLILIALVFLNLQI